MRGAPGGFGLGHNVALLVLWLRGPFCPLVFGLFGAWLLGVDMTAAVAPFFTLVLPIKSPPLSNDRDTGMHMISLPVVTNLLSGLFVSIKSPPLSTDRETGMHMVKHTFFTCHVSDSVHRQRQLLSCVASSRYHFY